MLPQVKGGRLKLALGLLGGAAAMIVAACGLSVSGADSTSLDGGNDGTVEGSSDDASGADGAQGGDGASNDSGDAAAADDLSIADVGPRDASLDVSLDGDAATCPDGSYACGPLCVNDCSLCFGQVGCPIGNVCVNSCAKGCGTRTTACYECNGGNSVATCEPFATATCLQGPYTHCGCDALNPCPGDTFCAGKPSKTACFTCGEPGTDKKICGAGAGTCTEATGQCK